MSIKTNDSLDKKKLESIECEEAEVKARKIILYKSFIHTRLEEFVYSYKLSHGAAAKVVKELYPKKPKIDKNAKLNLGDKISGRTLECVTPDIIKSKVTHISGKHKGKFLIVKKYVFCTVLIPPYGRLINQNINKKGYKTV